MLLLLKPGADQAAALTAFLHDVQDKKTSSYHQWLTPQQFGERFGVAQSDVDAITTWLEGEGFTVAGAAEGRQWIEFSGTTAQVESAFHTRIDVYAVNEEVNGQTHYANATEISIPAALAPVIAGVVSLSDFESTAAHTSLASGSVSGTPQLPAPQNLSRIYDLAPLYQSGVEGAGESIAIVARSNLRVSDIAAFRRSVALAPKAPQIMVNGDDPGFTGDEAEAALDAAWAGAIAPKATIDVIASASTHATDGIDLSIAYAVDHAVAPVIEASYVSCEANLNAAHAQFYAAAWAQAAAEGMTVVVATGDSGAAACEDQSGEAGGDAAITTAPGVNAIASTPYDTAVGGTSLPAEAFSTDTSAASSEESAWNDAAQLHAGGGGVSTLYATPDWQIAAGVPGADPGTGEGGPRHRLLPDVALNASDYQVCLDGSCEQGRTTYTSGTSASAAVFAGMMALVDEYTKSAQGNAAPELYTLARQQIAVHDVTTGTTKLPCAAGTNGCVSGEMGYAAADGFDLATGLGSIDANALARNFTTAATGTQLPLVVLSPGYQSSGPGVADTIAVAVSPASGTGPTPTGTVSFTDNYNNTTSAVGTAQQLTNGQVTYSFSSLTNGAHSISGVYSGDSNYSTGISSPVTILIQKFSTTLTLAVSTTKPAVGGSLTATASLVPSGSTAPTGSVQFTLDGVVVGTATINGSGTTYTASQAIPITTAGAHTIGATYGGDSNYASSSATPVPVTASSNATVTTLTSVPTVLTAGSTITFTAAISASGSTSTTNTFTGTMTFYDGTTAISSPIAIVNNEAVLSKITLDATVAHAITAVYSGDTNWAGSTSNSILFTVPTTGSGVTLQPSGATSLLGTLVTFTATVSESATSTASTTTAVPTGAVTFYDGTTPIGSATIVDNLGVATATFYTRSLAGGTHTITADYAGDSNYSASISNAATVTVESYTVTGNVTTLSLTQGGTGSVQFTVAALNGFASEVQFSCVAPSNTATTCSISPATLNGSGTTTMTIDTSGTSASSDARLPLLAGGGGALACMLLLCSSFGRRANGRLRGGAWLGLLLCLMFAGTLGCGNSSPAKGLSGTPTPPESMIFTVSSTASLNGQTATQQTNITVNVQPAS